MRSYGNAVLKLGATIRRSQFKGRMTHGRSHRPPDVTFIRHYAGAGEGFHICPVIVLGAEKLGKARSWQLIVSGETVPLQARSASAPERRGGSECNEQRKVRHHGAHH